MLSKDNSLRIVIRGRRAAREFRGGNCNPEIRKVQKLSAKATAAP